MKRFDDLTPTQQDKAVTKCVTSLLEAILEGAIRFNDKLNGDDLQARIDAAIARANALQTPWFAHEYILDTCRKEIEGMARCDAEDALYAERDEVVIKGVL